MSITMQFDGDGLKRMREALDTLGGGKWHDAARRALNHTGRKGHTAVRRSLGSQIGAGATAVSRYGALGERKANYGALAHVLYARGHVPLTAFGPRATSGGVSVAPFGKRRVLKKTFIVGKYGGNVFVRKSGKRFPLKKLIGVSIGKEMAKNPTVAAWRAVAASLPARVEHEVSVITRGVVS